MQLTKFTDYGLRVLMYLAAIPEQSLVTVGELAQRFDIPKNHLNKVVNRMVKQGWIIATPGRNGGVRIMQAPETLHLGDILQVMEGHTELVDCEQPRCVLKGNCYLKRILDIGQREFYVNMNRYSLAQLVQPETAGPQTTSILARMHFQSSVLQ